ncbi:MAG TPA: DUF305 domain-containing protein [Caulobacteraceae bacterium]
MKLNISVIPHGVFLAVGLGFVGMVGVSHAAPATDTEGPFLSLNQTAMTKMMADMEVKPTGNVDRDFVAMMTPHHQGAIAMAQAELLYGRNQKLLRIAQEIIAEQEQEIAAMRLAIGESARPTWVTNRTDEATAAARTEKVAARGDVSFVSQSNTAMDKMMADMAVKPTNNVDHDFVAMMVPHHQGAIDMAQAELRYGQNPQLKTISQEIIVDQMQEITLMRLALGEPLPASTSSPTAPSSSVAQTAQAHQSDANQARIQMSSAMRMTPISSAGAR